jgi:hypothetical protein
MPTEPGVDDWLMILAGADFRNKGSRCRMTLKTPKKLGRRSGIRLVPPYRTAEGLPPG